MKFFWSALLLAFSLHVSGQSVEKLKKVADEYYDAERYLEAAEFYEKVISLSPTDLESRYRQAFSYLREIQCAEFGFRPSSTVLHLLPWVPDKDQGRL